jgi:hypothetical protein
MYNTSDIAKVKDVDPELAEKAKNWMESFVTEYQSDNLVQFTDFFEEIRDGVLLCIMLNKIKPGLIAEKKFKPSKVVFVARTNIQLFIQGCKKLGVPETDCIETRDLFDQQNLAAVLVNIEAVSKIAHQHGWQGPFMTDKKYSEKNQRNFSAEVLAKSKSAVPQFAKGGIAHKQKGIDGYGIVKTDKEMQKPSQVQGAWQQGAKKVENKGMDGYGIVKTEKDMQKPSQVQSAWQKGSYKVDKSGMDGYGVVKTAPDMQKPSQVQGVWAQGAKKNESKGMDGYGIVKTDKEMQNPSQAQSVWQQGAKKNESQGMDSYGVVKKSQD